MLRLIGDSNIFAVEFEVLPAPFERRHYGTCGVWIDGFLVQERDSKDRGCEHYIENSASMLIGLVKAPASGSPPEVLTSIKSAEELASLCFNEEAGEALLQHLFLNGEGFDDFLSLAFKESSFTTFYSTFHPFRARNRDDFDEIYAGVSRDLHIAKIENCLIQKVVEAFEVALSETSVSCDL